MLCVFFAVRSCCVSHQDPVSTQCASIDQHGNGRNVFPLLCLVKMCFAGFQYVIFQSPYGKNVTFHRKTYINAFPLNDLELTPNKWKANDFSERFKRLS